jgi:organic radical activating enzyme
VTKQSKAPAVKLVAVTVRLTRAELAAVSRAAVVVISGGEPVVINAADRALRKLRDAAARHPETAEEIRGW